MLRKAYGGRTGGGGLEPSQAEAPDTDKGLDAGHTRENAVSDQRGETGPQGPMAREEDGEDVATADWDTR